MTKGELLKIIYGVEGSKKFDCALPINWISFKRQQQRENIEEFNESLWVWNVEEDKPVNLAEQFIMQGCLKNMEQKLYSLEYLHRIILKGKNGKGVAEDIQKIHYKE